MIHVRACAAARWTVILGVVLATSAQPLLKRSQIQVQLAVAMIQHAKVHVASKSPLAVLGAIMVVSAVPITSSQRSTHRKNALVMPSVPRSAVLCMTVHIGLRMATHVQLRMS
jgi:hypothetical protein